jgi:hypothetical protein
MTGIQRHEAIGRSCSDVLRVLDNQGHPICENTARCISEGRGVRR